MGDFVQAFEDIGAEVEQKRDNKFEVLIDGYQGVDSDVPKTYRDVASDGSVQLRRGTKRMAAPRPGQMRVITTGGKRSPEYLTMLRNKWKVARSAFEFAANEDKEAWERKRDIAFHEMQAEAFRNKLALYQENPGRAGDAEARPEQVKVYRRKVWEHEGELRELLEGN